ncbi:MAG: hypothetical protein KJO24_04755, partial [Gammaproteobacteria bacterium]|nr:hypothetical protein [Gammaproteobacteria bacterium]
MNRQRKSLPKNLNAIAGGLSLVVITLYVADLGLQPSRIFKPTPTQAIDPLAAKTADRIGTGLVVERFDQNGKLSQRFSSLRAEYFNQPVTRENNDTNGTLEDSFDESDLFFNDHAKPYNIVVKVSEPVIKVFEAGEAIAEL